jgi:hypothetical protein
MSEIALGIAALPKENKNRSRIVIITQGKDDVIIAQGPPNIIYIFFLKIYNYLF